jgi:hypothetical protein
MARRFPLLLTLMLALLAACAAPTDTAPMRLLVAPELADDTLAAVALWSDATAGAYAPEVVITADCPLAADGLPSVHGDFCVMAADAITEAECPEPDAAGQDRAAPRACTQRRIGGWSSRTTISRSGTLPAERVSTIAHELGHTLGLAHLLGTGDLMDIDRAPAARRAPCVSERDTELAGMPGPGACQ